MMVKGYKFFSYMISSGDLMYSMLTIVNSTVLYSWKLPRK